jgi:hypothetical protein
LANERRGVAPATSEAGSLNKKLMNEKNKILFF